MECTVFFHRWQSSKTTGTDVDVFEAMKRVSDCSSGNDDDGVGKWWADCYYQIAECPAIEAAEPGMLYCIIDALGRNIAIA